jgi:bifunctional DNA-binding transcriptional regulator/antitoxin component of YhaV-PrlF toxin-antitoxin module
MEAVAESVVGKKYIRVRDRNQITLPSELIEGLPIHAGDFLEICRTKTGLIYLKPAVLVTVGSPEALKEEALAEADINAGRYGTFDSAESLIDDIKGRRKQRRKIAANTATMAV